MARARHGLLFYEKLSKLVRKADLTQSITTIHRNIAGEAGKYYLYYFGKEKINNWDFVLPQKGLEDGMKFKVELIDTWNMTITPVNTIFEIEKLNRYKFIDKKRHSVKFPGKPYMAMRITLIEK